MSTFDETDQLVDLVPSLDIKLDTTYKGIEDNNGWKAYRFDVTLRRESGRVLSVPYFSGLAITHPPSIADVLFSLTMDTHAGEMSFEEFCSEFDYDTDSRKAHATWSSCAEMAPKVREFLGDDFETVASAEH